MRRSSAVKWVLSGIALAAVLLAVPAIYDNRERKLEVYRAFVSAYSEGHRVNLANVTTRFDAETEGVISCAPTVLATTLVSRLFRTTTLNQTDFADSSIHVVDPDDQAAQVRIHDPSMNISSESDVDRAVADAFEAGLLQVSEVGFDITGQHAMLTFSFRCGMLCGHGGTAVFDRVGDRWVWSQRRCGSEWMS
ncbi:MAG: hypothetical protein KF779_04190 [Hyphomonadaceae bacterium]|nr:hypothetical protein [Hyphomonadaceae bacterium]